MGTVPEMLEIFSGMEEELKRSVESLESVSGQFQGLRRMVEDIDADSIGTGQAATGRRLSFKAGPLSPKSRVLQEPAALLTHRQVKGQKTTSTVAKVTSAPSAKATEAGASQLRLHGRWMDLATQSAGGDAGPATESWPKRFEV